MAYQMVFIPEAAFIELKHVVTSPAVNRNNYILMGKFMIVSEIHKEWAMTDKPKAKMTRKEAVECFKKYHVYGDPNDTVDFYIEAGMLEIVEEEKKPIILGYQFDHIVHELECAGYKVIKR
jgi:hypothetical protein